MAIIQVESLWESIKGHIVSVAIGYVLGYGMCSYSGCSAKPENPVYKSPALEERVQNYIDSYKQVKQGTSHNQSRDKSD